VSGTLNIAISGSSGLLGSSLAAFLERAGHRVFRLVRRPARPDAREIHWSVSAGEVDTRALEGVDAVVHLAGENLASGWWTQAQKRRIQHSRVAGTRILSEALARLERPPQVFVSASAIGYYGDRGEETVNEDSAPGRGFLAELARAWEAAAEPASRKGIRVVTPRIGLVLSGGGGLLTAMLPAFQFGLGARIGNARRYWSWIDHADVLGVIYRAICRDTLSGPVNTVAPHPVTQGEFVATLARVLNRPAVLSIPETAIRMLLGEMGQELMLTGARVDCRRLREDGFRFLQPNLEGSLRHQLGR